MSIILQPEQKKAYNKIMKAFKNGEQIVNLISATGTGKSYVVEKIIETNHWANSTIVVANTKRLLAQWQAMNPCVQTITYQSLKKLTDEVLANIKLIVFDESHHVGAPEWRKKIDKAISNYNGKVITCTATPVRNDDIDSRDIFGGDTVEMMTQAQALESEKFAPVKYINAVYNNPDNLSYWHKKVVNRFHMHEFDLPKDPVERESLANLLFEIDKYYTDGKKNNVLAKTLQTYVGRGYKKTLVFCESIETLDKLYVYFKQVFPKAHVYFLHCGCTFEENEEQLKKFNKDKTKAFLISVNMISEGYHLHDIDSVVLLRKTGSAVLYSQQIGRVLNSFNLDTTKTILDLASVEFTVRITNNHLRINRNSLHLLNQLIAGFKKSKRVQFIKQTSDITHHISEILETVRERTLGRKPWTKEEEEYIKKNYIKMTCQEIADVLGRSAGTVFNKIKKLGIPLCKCKLWTKQEDDYLKKNYSNMTRQKIANVLGRTERSVSIRLGILGLITRSLWTKEEDDYIKKNYIKMTYQEIADVLGRTKCSVYSRAIGLGLSSHRSSWTKEEDDYLKKNRGKMTYQEIADALGRTKNMISIRATGLGLSSHMVKMLWTKEEDDYLKKNHSKMPYQEIADALDKTKYSVQNRISILGLITRSLWTKEEDDYLKKNHSKMPYQEIADALGRTKCSVCHRITKLGLATRSLWTKEEEEYIKKNYIKMTYQEIADALGRTKTAVIHRLVKLGMSKDQTKKKKNNKKKGNDKKNKRKKNKGQ